MCGRYAFMPEDVDPVLARMIDRMDRDERESITMGRISPGDRPMVITMQGSKLDAHAMRWGMPLPEEPRLVINARAESAAEKAMFAGLLPHNRCLMPASLYFEWTRNPAHTRMQVRGESKMYMAGLYRRSMEAAAEWEFVVLTRPASEDVARVHDRMPLILPDRASCLAWLRDEVAARRMLNDPPEVRCGVQADEPEQLDMFDLLDQLEL